MVPPIRIRAANRAPVRADRALVLYWMIASRRVRFNLALERAVEHARALDLPLVVLEGLGASYRWASDRLHRFVLDGMADTERALARRPVLYHPFVSPRPGAGRGLVEALAARAAAVVTDHFPSAGLPALVARTAGRLDVRVEAVDANGLLPLAAAERVFPTAFAFRRFLQRSLPAHLGEAPAEDPLRGARLRRLEALPDRIAERWPRASRALLDGDPAALAAIPIDHAVPPAPIAGGAAAGSRALARFLSERLARYADERNHPDAEAASGLSPYLHFGHVAAHEVAHAVLAREGFSPGRIGRRASGQRAGWWGIGAPAEAFLDQLVTWRELGFNMSDKRDDHATYGSLPAWARRTLDDHRDDPRPELYDDAALDEARTADPVWNAAQTELLRTGTIHGYLRMLWGKNVLAWSARPEQALERLVRMNDRLALDGRDPSSYSGIGWVLGRYDRAWGPERPVFGKVRYMTSASALRKLRMKRYLARWGG